MLSDVLPFITNDVPVGPEATGIIGEAFEVASRNMRDTGQPKIVLEIIAKRIIDIVRSGERDPEQIARRALSEIGLQG